MKKLIAFLLIATALTACDNSSETKTEVLKDSVTAAESPLMDAQNTADSVGRAIKDSVEKY